jgi:hypothetical protein
MHEYQIYRQELDGDIARGPDALLEVRLMTLSVLAFDLLAPFPMTTRDVHEVSPYLQGSGPEASLGAARPCGLAAG